jgi:hypothetical protein
MGIFDWPAPLFAGVDGLMHFLPPAFRVALWAIVGAALSMAIYRAMSPQRRIAVAQADARKARRDLDVYDGELCGVWRLVGRALGTAGYQLWLMWPAALLASLPLLAMTVWLSTAYGYRFPRAEDAVGIEVKPARFDAQLLERFQGPEAPPDRRVLVTDRRGVPVVELPLPAPVPVVEKRQWWNFFIGNPAGYLPADGGIERVELSLPKWEIVPLGPGWVRGWEILYFSVLILSSIAIKKLCRIA